MYTNYYTYTKYYHNINYIEINTISQTQININSLSNN